MKQIHWGNTLKIAQRPRKTDAWIGRRLVFSALATVLVFSAGLAHGQGDALYINENGNVGINTTQPQGFQIQLPESSKPPAPNPGVTLSGGAEGDANIELRNNGTGSPYIDFSQSSAADYDARIRLIEPGKLAVEGATVKAKSFETEAGVSLAAIQNAVNMLMPIGTIIAYGGDTSNREIVQQLGGQGWLPCDGRTVTRQDYGELFNVIGASFGAGDSRTTFQVPDFRGRFLRGTDQGTNRDPDAGSRRAEPNGGNSGDRVGSVQDDQFKAHRHTYTVFPHSDGNIASGRYWQSGNAETGSTGGNETRPKNVNVNWIIKAKHLLPVVPKP